MATVDVGATPVWEAHIASDGAPISSNSLKGTKYIIAFFPKSSTPGCTQEMNSLSKEYDSFIEEGYQVYGCSADDLPLQCSFISKQCLKQPLISDTEHSLCKAFGVYGEKKMFGRTTVGIIRSSFIIDENGAVSHVINKVDTKNHANQLLNIINPEKYELSSAPTRKLSKRQLVDSAEAIDEEGQELNKSGRPRRTVSRSASTAAVEQMGGGDDDDGEKDEERTEKTKTKQPSTPSDGTKKRGRPKKSDIDASEEHQDGEDATKRTKENEHHDETIGSLDTNDDTVQLDHVGVSDEIVAAATNATTAAPNVADVHNHHVVEPHHHVEPIVDTTHIEPHHVEPVVSNHIEPIVEHIIEPAVVHNEEPIHHAEVIIPVHESVPVEVVFEQEQVPIFDHSMIAEPIIQFHEPIIETGNHFDQAVIHNNNDQLHQQHDQLHQQQHPAVDGTVHQDGSQFQEEQMQF